MNTLGMIAIVVDDYDSAISHYVNDLGFTLIEDTTLTQEKRWVVVAPSLQGARILLAKAANEAQVTAIGKPVVESDSLCIQLTLMKYTKAINLKELSSLKLPAKRPMVKLWYSKTTMEINAVSYTHLTLPTIYSV